MYVSVLGRTTKCIFHCVPCQRLKGIVLIERTLQFITLRVRHFDLVLTLTSLFAGGA